MTEGELIIPPKIPANNDIVDIEKVIDQFLLTKKSANTKRAYSKDLLDLFDSIGVLTINSLGEIMFDELVNRIQVHIKEIESYDKTDTKKKWLLNPKTVNRKAYAISSFFKFLMHSYNYPKNPLALYTSHKFDRSSNTPSLKRSELMDVLSYAKDRRFLSQTTYRDYLILCFLTVLALRRNELIGIKWRDFHQSDQSLKVIQKGGSCKNLPVPKTLLDSLLDYQQRYKVNGTYVFSRAFTEKKKTFGKASNQLPDRPLNSNYIYQMVTRVVSAVVEGRHATPHSFRKTFIEIALDNKEDFISIVNATGHSTVEMIKYYDGRDSLKNNAANRMADLI